MRNAILYGALIGFAICLAYALLSRGHSGRIRYGSCPYYKFVRDKCDELLQDAR